MNHRITAFLLLFLAAQFVHAEPTWKLTGDTIPTAAPLWRPIIEQMAEPELSDTAIELSNFTITSVDFRLELKKGKLYLFEPVVIDGQPVYYAGYFVGDGFMWFKPPIRTEQAYVRRFFGEDSLAIKADQVILSFDQTQLAWIREDGTTVTGRPGKRSRAALNDGLKALTKHSKFGSSFYWAMLISYPQTEPWLMVQVIKDRFDQVAYEYDPMSREQVSLSCVYPESNGFELVCSYYEGVHESLDNINGENREAINLQRFEVKATVDTEFVLWADVTMTSQVLDSSAQFLDVTIHPNVVIDGVEMADGVPLEYFREKWDDHYSRHLRIILSSAPDPGSILTLRFRYHGNVAKTIGDNVISGPGFWWCPDYGYGSKAVYDLSFKTPGRYVLVVSAPLVDSSRVGDTLMTHWITDRPEMGVTFSLGEFTSTSFTEEGLPDIEIFYHPAHTDTNSVFFEKNWDEDVVPPIYRAMKLYANIFGPPARDDFHVTESPYYWHAESYPGQINLPYWTFFKGVRDAEKLFFQAHEIAHQWWGNTVGYETYHDKWLCEGMAEYSALRMASTYLDYEIFLEKLRRYRNAVYSVRRGWLFKGVEAGPIIQGYRTASSKTPDDYMLVIYHKAALVMHMLRCHLTDWNTLDDSRFNDFLKEFYRQYAGKNASTYDFKHLLEEQTGIDWTWFFDQWIYGNELPVYKFTRHIEHDDSDGMWRAHCTIEQKDVPDDFTVIMPVEIDFGKDSKQYTAFVVKGASKDFTLAFEDKPKEIRLNPFEAVLCKVEQ